jgi:hypothetical protein
LCCCCCCCFWCGVIPSSSNSRLDTELRQPRGRSSATTPPSMLACELVAYIKRRASSRLDDANKVSKVVAHICPFPKWLCPAPPAPPPRIPCKECREWRRAAAEREVLLRVAFLSHLEQLTVRKGYLIAAWLGACFFLEEEPKRQTGRKERRTPKQHVAVVARLTSICRNKPNLSYSGEAVELSDPHPTHSQRGYCLPACLRVVYINNLSCSFPRFKKVRGTHRISASTSTATHARFECWNLPCILYSISCNMGLFGHETCLASRPSWVLFFFLRRLFLRFSKTWFSFCMMCCCCRRSLLWLLLLTAVGFFPLSLSAATAHSIFFKNTVVPQGSSEAAT